MTGGERPGAGPDPERVLRAALSRVVLAGDCRVHRALERRADRDPAGGGQVGDAHLGGIVDHLVAPADLRRGRRDLEDIAAMGGRFLVPGDPEWPVDAFDGLARACAGEVDPDGAGRPGPGRLAPPYGLWALGPASLADLPNRAVAVVGSRAATSYGEHVARELAFGLAERGWTVVSGGAYGIDAAAHRGAVAASGRTVVVLACGVDVAYPKGHRPLYDAVLRSGLLLSEHPPGTPVAREQFLVRNRLIAALAAGTVVVEAPARSGALATARRAHLLGRPLMAVPGPVTSALSVGPHLLLREYGALLVTGAPSVVDILGPVGELPLAWPRGADRRRDTLDQTARSVLDVLDTSRPVDVADVAQRTRLPVAVVARVLADLVDEALVVARPGGWVVSRAGTVDGDGPPDWGAPDWGGSA